MHRLAGDFREIIREQVEFVELLYQIASRDLLLRYKQTAMGFAWAVVTPVLHTVIFTIVFTRVAPVSTPVPYPVFAYCGLLAWNFTAPALRFAVVSLTSNANLVTKVYFPREIFPFAAIFVATVDFLVAAVVLAGMMVYYGIAPGATIVLLPVVIVVQAAFTAALALLLSMANLFYRDVKYLFEIVLTVWMFASAVLYPVDALSGWLGMAVRANPMTAVIEAYRNVLLYGRLPDPSFMWSAVAICWLLPAVWIMFHRLEFQFAERI
jgi:ABC-type polysaccharide/polyol phosphate export permease